MDNRDGDANNPRGLPLELNQISLNASSEPVKNSILSVVIIALTLVLPAMQTPAATPVQTWAKHYSASPGSKNIAKKILTDGAGNVLIAGYSDDGTTLDLVVLKYSSAGLPLWTNRYPGPLSDTNDFPPLSMALDASGNVFVAGSSAGSNGVNTAPIGYNDYVTIAYSAAGVGLWTNRYDGPVSYLDSPYGVAVDHDGNVLVTGRSYGPPLSPNYLTIKYSASGLPLWTNRYVSTHYWADAYAVAVDTAGEVFVTGRGWVDAGDPPSGYDYVTIKYSSAGARLWTRTYSNPLATSGRDYATAMAVDSSGNVIVTGTSMPAWTQTYEFATVKYSGDGTQLWVNRGGGYEPKAIALDASGNVFVTGCSSLPDSRYSDFYTVACSSAGSPLWTRTYNGTGYSNDVAHAIATDPNGNVVVIGSSYSSSGTLDCVTIKYSPAGVPLWTNRYDGLLNGNDEALSLAVKPAGAVYFTGSSAASPDSISDFLTLKYVEVSPIKLTSPLFVNGALSLEFTNTPGAAFSVLAATNLAAPLSLWNVLGSAQETVPGLFQFDDTTATNSPVRFYGVSSP